MSGVTRNANTGQERGKTKIEKKEQLLLTLRCALCEYFTTSAHFWQVNLSMVETALDIWIFKQRKLSDWVSADISSAGQSKSKQEAVRKLQNRWGRRGRNGESTVLLPLCLTWFPAGTRTWRAGALLTQHCLQPEGNFSDRQQKVEFYFLFSRQTSKNHLQWGFSSSLASLNTDMNNQ